MPLPSIHAGLKLDEVVPAPLDHVSGVSHSTALVQRKRLRLVPQTAATANPGDIINFLIQDPGMLDLQSAVFHANISVTAGSGGNPSLDDGPAWLRQLVIQVDGQNLETQDRCNKLTNMETYMSASPALYNRQLSFAGYWKFNNDLASFTSSTASKCPQFQDVSANLVAANSFYTTTTYGWDVAVPLGLVSHVFRSERLFPSRFANNLLIQMQLESAGSAIFSGGTTNATTTYQLNNIYLNIDSVTLNPAFTAFLQDQVMDPNGSGITLPFCTKISAQGQSQNNSGENTFVVSRASKNLKRIAVVQQPAAALGAAGTNYPEISTFPSAGFNTRGQTGQVQGQVQLYIAGQYYPLFPARGSDAFMVAVQAYNGHPLVDSEGPIVNYRIWGTTTDVGTSPAYGTTNTGSAPYSDCWIWAYDLSKMVGSSYALEHDGVDSTGNAQIQVTIKTGPKENGSAAESYTPLVEMVGTKYLTIANGELTIMG